MKHAPINPPPVAICAQCETEYLGSAHPPRWQHHFRNGTGHTLICADCAQSNRARARKGGAA